MNAKIADTVLDQAIAYINEASKSINRLKEEGHFLNIQTQYDLNIIKAELDIAREQLFIVRFDIDPAS